MRTVSRDLDDWNNESTVIYRENRTSSKKYYRRYLRMPKFLVRTLGSLTKTGGRNGTDMDTIRGISWMCERRKFRMYCLSVLRQKFKYDPPDWDMNGRVIYAGWRSELDGLANYHRKWLRWGSVEHALAFAVYCAQPQWVPTVIPVTQAIGRRS